MNPQKEIGEFFLRALLRISLVGTILIIIFDYFFQKEFFWYDGTVDLVILISIIVSFVFFSLNYYHASVLTITSVTLMSMLYQSVSLRNLTTMSFSVILMVGFAYSILLKGRLKMIMHGITLAGMLAVFIWQSQHFEYYMKPNPGEIISMGATYLTLYVIITYTSGYLKMRYDAINQELINTNSELVEKASEIETQNEELVRSQQNLYELNLNLEKMVHERTDKIKQQNEQLIKYSYNNAHHLRGPVARVLGLIQVSRLAESVDHALLFQKIEEQTYEIDAVVRKINDELGF